VYFLFLLPPLEVVYTLYIKYGIFCIFVVSNYFLVYFLIWSVRIKGWGFGMGYLFGCLTQIAGFLFSHFKRLASKKRR